MTTAHSPPRVLKRQADKIAAMLKAAERKDKVNVLFGEKLLAARNKDSIKVAIAMDDKTIAIEMPWTLIHSTSETGLSAWLLKEMRKVRGQDAKADRAH